MYKPMKRVLLLLPTTSYRNHDFLTAAEKLEVEVIKVANYCHRLAPLWGIGAIQSVAFDQPEEALQQILAVVTRTPDAVLAVDDSGLELAALLREHWRLPGNSSAAILATHDKLSFRQLLRSGGLNCPAFYHFRTDSGIQAYIQAVTRPVPVPFPVVVKARRLSASRGVIRADTAQTYREAVQWVCDIQATAERESAALGLIVESFIPGSEHALDGLLHDGRLSVLALFDKPDPLNGPYFEETLYVTPSRLTSTQQEEIVRTVERACGLAGLSAGPIHAEMRVNDQGIWLLEIAARSIGGLCSRMLHQALGMSLEECILRDALGLAVPTVKTGKASGVMMIPVPARGILRSITGVAAARATEGIDDIRITADPGQIIAPPPEGASYLGFIFASGTSPEAVENSLRQAHRQLGFKIQREIPVGQKWAS
jgi:biotin carboxylase